MIRPKGFQIWLDYKDFVDALTDAEAGELFRAILTYANDGTIIEMSASPKIAFIKIKKDMDSMFEKYEHQCKVNAENAKKGGAPKGNKNASKQPTRLNSVELGCLKQPKTTETTQKENKKQKIENNYIDDEVYKSSGRALQSIIQHYCYKFPFSHNVAVSLKDIFYECNEPAFVMRAIDEASLTNATNPLRYITRYVDNKLSEVEYEA